MYMELIESISNISSYHMSQYKSPEYENKNPGPVRAQKLPSYICVVRLYTLYVQIGCDYVLPPTPSSIF